MPYFLTMSPERLRAEHHSALQRLAMYEKATSEGLAHGIRRENLRSAEYETYWRRHLRLIEGVARRRGITL